METYRLERTVDQKEWTIHEGAEELSEEMVSKVAAKMFTDLVTVWLQKKKLPKGLGMRIICNEDGEITDEVTLQDVDVEAARKVVKQEHNSLTNDIQRYIRSVYVNVYKMFHGKKEGDIYELSNTQAKELEKIIREEEECLDTPLRTNSLFPKNSVI